MTIRYKDEFGNPLVAIEKGDEIHAYNIDIVGTFTLPDEECIEVFMQGNSDFYFGDKNLQNIVIPAGSTLVLDVNNTNIITLSGNATISVVVLK